MAGTGQSAAALEGRSIAARSVHRPHQKRLEDPPGSVSGLDDDDDDPNPIEAQRRRWLSPGATPGPGPGYHDARPAVSRKMATGDAAAARDLGYYEYVNRISNAWRAR